jgi:tryptophan synthase alpha chain
MNRIDALFARKRSGILSVFFTAGFPRLDDTVALATQLEKAGADMIEMGIPFSDPVADGPVIQQSNTIALGNGMNVEKLLTQLTEIRGHVGMPILLMGYLNPVLRYGFDRFCERAASAGADGLILPDLPLEEYSSKYRSMTGRCGLKVVFLVTPQTPEARIRHIDSLSGGFVYAVSASSTTGMKGRFTDEQLTYFDRLAAMNLRNPVLVGFGVSNRETFSSVCQRLSGAIVGSAFIRHIGAAASLEEAVPQFVRELRPA